MVSVRDFLLASASWVTFMIAALHFLLVQNSNWANGPTRAARSKIFWCVSLCYLAILIVVVIWRMNVRRLLRFEIAEPIIIYYGFVFNILLSLAFPEETLLVIVICSLLAYSLFSLIELIQPTISLGTLSLVLSVLSYKVYVTDTFWLWRVLFGLQCLMLPMWFWTVTRTTKRNIGTEVDPEILTTGRTTVDDDGRGGDQLIDVGDAERPPAQVPTEMPERPPAQVPSEIQATGRSTDDDGGDEITAIDEEVAARPAPIGGDEITAIDEEVAARPAPIEGIALPPQEGGSAETGAQTPTTEDQIEAALKQVLRHVVVDVAEEVRDTIVAKIVIRDVMSMIGAEIEGDVATEVVRDAIVAKVIIRDVISMISAEIERDVVTEGARDKANVAEVIFRAVCIIVAEFLRDVVAEDMRDAISIATVVIRDVYGLIIDEVVRDAITAEVDVRDVMRDISIQIPDDGQENDNGT